MYLQKLKEMFTEMVLKKDASVIPIYYHPDFLFYTNDVSMDYDAYLKFHEERYATPVNNEVQYDEETLLEQGEKIAGRIWITTNKLNEPAKKFEMILIAQYKDGKIYRLWELSYPY